MTIGRILKGDVSPQVDTLEKLAKGLKIPLSALCCADDSLKHIITKIAKMTPKELDAVKTILNI